MAWQITRQIFQFSWKGETLLSLVSGFAAAMSSGQIITTAGVIPTVGGLVSESPQNARNNHLPIDECSGGVLLSPHLLWTSMNLMKLVCWRDSDLGPQHEQRRKHGNFGMFFWVHFGTFLFGGVVCPTL